MRESTALRLTIGVLWITATIAAVIYAWRKSIPADVAIPAGAAFLAEGAFYVAAGFASVREWLSERPGRLTGACWLAASGMLPYLIYCAAPGRFSLAGFAILAAVAVLASFWFVVLPHRPWADILYLSIFAAVLISGVMRRVYPPVAEKAPVDILGHLALIHMGVVGVLGFRRLPGVGFGFIPSRGEWSAGVRNFLLFLVPMLAIGIGLGFARPRAVDWSTVLPTTVGTFFAFLWVVALSEELFFRGMLLPLAIKLFSNRWAGLIATSAVFGLCHLTFRQFPNWNFALLAGLAGLFYGRAFLETQSVRAAMVTHALVVTVWRVFMV